MATEKFEIVITSKGARTVKRDFDSVATSAERTSTSAERMGQTIDSSMRRGGQAIRRTQSDYRGLQREMKRTGQSGTELTGRLAALNRAFVVPGAAQASLRNAGRSLRGLIGLFSAFYTVRYLGEAADSYTRMGNALKGFGVGANSVNRVRKEVTGLSNDARVDAEQATVLFGRLRLATRDLGASERDVLDVTGTVNKALRLSGASSLEASQSIRQLSQAFNKGKLDGDEFRSVLENAPILTKLLSEELGISKRELRDWARQGKISVKTLYDTLRNGQSQINEEFAKLQPTLGDAFVVFYNKLREFVGDTPAITTSMKVLVGFLELVGDNLSTVLGLLQGVAVVKVGRSVLNLLGGAGRAVSSAASALSGAGAVAPGLALAGAPAANASIVGTTASAALLASQTGQVKRLDEAFGLVNNKVKGTNELLEEGTVVAGPGGLGGAFKKLGSFIRRVWGVAKRILTPFNALLAVVLAVGAGIASGMVKHLEDASTSTTAWGEATKLLGQYWRTFGRYIEVLLRGVGAEVDKAVKKVDEIFTLLLVSAKAVFVAIKKLMVELIIDIRDGLRIVEQVLSALNAQGIATPGKGVVDVLLGEAEDFSAAGGLRGKTFMQAYQQAVEDEFELLGSDKGGMFGRFKQFTSELGFLFTDFLKGRVLEQELRDNYQKAFEAVQEEAGKIKDLFGSDDGAGSFLNSTEIDTQIQKLQQLVDLYDEARIKPDDLNDEETANVKNAITTLGEIRSFLQTTAESISAFDAIVRQGSGTEGEIEAALSRLETEIETSASKLPPELKAAAIAGANQMITEARAILVAGATDIGAAVRTALLTGFGGAVGGLLNAASLTASPTDPNGNGLLPSLTPNAAAEAIGDGGASEIRAAQTAAENYNNTLSETLRRLNQFEAQGSTAFDRAGNNAKNAANDIQQFFEGAFSSLEDALVGFVTTGKLDFKSLINSIIADLARMVIRMLIIKPLMGFFGGIFGFSGGGIVPGFKNGGIVPAYAGGGIVSGFGGARQDNQLIAASPGEMIINAGSTKANREELQYINKTGQMPPGGASMGTTVFAPNITINESGNDPQLTAQMVDAAVKRSWTELAVKAQRKGGVLDSRRNGR